MTTILDRAIIDHAMIARCLADINSWNGWSPEPPPSVRRPIYVLKLQANQDGSGIRSLRQLLKMLGRHHGLRCIDAREEQPLEAYRDDVLCLPRAPATVRITREDKAWLVVVGSHGWLHGDQRSALADARWLADNFGLPIRRDREGAT
jgi:hypothetical protein